ncbi:hypothetical protein F5Y16DRAFT_370262 [Xylariaceae sp. FL0255]|nr:hypothetical protein F5Y16DRAFT_370262 [Xylariaceae sp. FL0255]
MPSSQQYLVGTSIEQLAYKTWKPLSLLFHEHDRVLWKSQDTEYDESGDGCLNDLQPESAIPQLMPISKPCLRRFVTPPGYLQDKFRLLTFILRHINLAGGMIILAVLLTINLYGTFCSEDWMGVPELLVRCYATSFRILLLIHMIVVIFFVLIILLALLPVAASPGCPCHCRSCLCYVAYRCLGPRCIRTLCNIVDCGRFLSALDSPHPRRHNHVLPQLKARNNPYNGATLRIRGTSQEKLYRLLKQDWFEVRLSLGSSHREDSIRFAIATYLVFYSSFRRHLLDDHQLVKVLPHYSVDGFYWRILPSPKNFHLVDIDELYSYVD